VANTLDDSIAQWWSRTAQVIAKQNLVARQISSFREQAGLQEGDRVHRPIFTDPAEQAVSSDGSYTPTDITDSKESLIVDQWRHATVVLNEKNRKQLTYDFMRIQAGRAGYFLAQRLDRVILGEYANADFNTTAAALNVSNITEKALAGKADLFDAQCETDRPWFWVVDPTIDSLVAQAKISNGFREADSQLIQGTKISMQPFVGLNVMVSNSALTWVGEILAATQPTNTDTVVFTFGSTSVTFTFVTSIGTTAGNVLIGGTDATARANFVTLFNAPTVTAATGVAIGAAGSAAVKAVTGVTASNDDVTNEITLTSIKGRCTLAHTLTASGDGIQNMVLHTLMGKTGAIDLVFQKDFSTQFRPVSRKLATDAVTSGLYGYKTFADGARCMLDFRVTTQADALTA
jgi:hypothetical protein